MIISVNEIFNFYDLYNSSWGGAINNLDLIKAFLRIENLDESIFLDDINDYIKNIFNGSIDRTELNDLLWFDDLFICDFFNNHTKQNTKGSYDYWYDELHDYIIK